MRLGTTTKDYHKMAIDILNEEYPKYPKMKKGPKVESITNISDKPNLLDDSIKFSSVDDFLTAV